MPETKLSELDYSDLNEFLVNNALSAVYKLPENYRIDGVDTILVKDKDGWGIKCGEYRLQLDGMWSKNKLGRWASVREALEKLEEIVFEDSEGNKL